MATEARPRVAILDRNPHVREFLCREFECHGFAAAALDDVDDLLRRGGVAALAGDRSTEVVDHDLRAQFSEE